MKRNFRSVKFAEYLSTFAHLHQIHLHPTLLIEKRDPSRGYGMYVRDAVDAGTTLLVVPQQSIMTQRTLERLGTGISSRRLRDAVLTTELPSHSLRFPVMDLLLMGLPAAEWVVFAWQLSLELSARHSYWWGWLSSVPSLQDLKDQEQSAQVASRAVAPHLVGQMAMLREALHRELEDAFALFVVPHADVVPTRDHFKWAAHLVLTRSIVVPPVGPLTDEDALPDVAVVPFIDLCNMSTPPASKKGPTRGGALVPPSNAQIEFLDGSEGVPEWSRVEREAGQFTNVRSDLHHNGIMLTLNAPLAAGDEVLLDDAAVSLRETNDDHPFVRSHEALRHCSDLATMLRMQRFHIPF